jgi:hypothetical protein
MGEPLDRPSKFLTLHLVGGVKSEPGRRPTVFSPVDKSGRVRLGAEKRR